VKLTITALKKVVRFSEKYEKLLVLLLLPVFLFPIWYHDYFPTLDTPAHIYNANVLWNIWFGDHQIYNHYFESNHWLNPNWISQPLLSVLTQVFNTLVCEKIVLSLYIIGFVLAFRTMILQMNPITPLFSLLGFVFVYNNTFMMGFLNYNFGIVFLFLSIASLLRFYTNQKAANVFWLFFCLTALFYSHLVMFCVFGLFVVAFFMITMTRDYLNHEKIWFCNIRTFTSLLLSSAIPISLLIVYLINAKGDEGILFFTPAKIIEDILRQAGSLSISTNEKVYLRWNWIVPLIGLCIAISATVIAKLRNGKNESWWKPTFNEAIILLFVLFILVAIFILPDSTVGGSGLLTDRLIFQFTTFFFVSVLLSFRKKLILIPVLLILLYVSVDRLFFIHREMFHFQKTCANMMQSATKMTDGGCIAFFNFSNKWLAQHYVSHIAAQHNLMVLDNWSDKSYNSVRWKGSWIESKELLCWQDQQWKCNLFELERLLNQKIRWFLIVNDDRLESESANCLIDWPTFLRDSCHVVHRSGTDVVLYKRNGT